MSTTFQNVIKAFALIAITMAIAVAISSVSYSAYNDQQSVHMNGNSENVEGEGNDTVLLLPSKRVSRFLAESNYSHHGRSLKPADHCHKDEELCDSKYGENFYCCGNKCFDFSIDKKHCGSCKNKCKFTYDCCNGRCVDKAYDKSHCGRCNNKCLKGQYCVYGMCDYA